MRILFVHQNLPGQFKHLLSYYGGRDDCQVVGIGESSRLGENFRCPIPGVRLLGYKLDKRGSSDVTPALRTTEEAVRRGQAVLGVLVRLKHAGFYPDVVYAHPGWGDTLFLKDVFPEARLIHFCEFYYNTTGQDFSFDPEYLNTAEDVLRLRVRNLHHLMSLEHADLGIAPTYWQRSVFPDVYKDKIEVVHDGIDSDVLRPDPEAFIEFPGKGVRLTTKDEVVTYVSRNLEPYRGFHTFMRALPELLRKRPQLHVVVVGGNGVSYGRRASDGTWRETMLAEVGSGIDPARVHFVGKVPYSTFLRVLQVSTAHIYLTYPFVLSWSMLEAMSVGCVVIGSRTKPVEEILRNNENGMLVDFFSPTEVVEAIHTACEERGSMERLRFNARRTVLQAYDLRTVCLPKQRQLIETPIAAHRSAVLGRLDVRESMSEQ